jgi:cholesterol transport system auxiliary component
MLGGFMHKRICFLGLVLLSITAGCSILPKAEPEQQYFLTVNRKSVDIAGEVPIVVVERPTAVNPLNTNKILLTQASQEIMPLKGASWADTIPQIIQDLLVERLQGYQKFVPVSREGSGLRATYLVQTDIRAFYVTNWPTKPAVTIEIRVNYIDIDKRHLLFTKTFRRQQLVEGTGINMIIQAFQQNITLILADISEQINEQTGKR